MSQTFEATAMDALLFQGSDQSFHHPVLLRAVWCDELLLQAVASDQFRVGARREHQPVVAAKKEGLIDCAQRAETGDQGMFKRGHCRRCLAGSRQMRTSINLA